MPTNVCIPDTTAEDSVSVSAREVPLPARREALDAASGLRDGRMFVSSSPCTADFASRKCHL